MKSNPFRVREAARVVVMAYFRLQRNERGDQFATEAEMRMIESDPLAWLALLQGEKARRLFEAIL